MLDGSRGARRYETLLLEELRAAAAAPTPQALSARAAPSCAEDEPLLWARSGSMWLTGDAEPRLAAGAPASCAEGALDAVRALAGEPAALVGLSGAALLGERAAAFGLSRGGCESAGRSCRVLRSMDGWLALNLPRPSDVSLLPAWLESEGISSEDDPWPRVREAIRRRPARPLVERGRLMGLALAATPEIRPDAAWLRSTPFGDEGPPRSRPPRVVDLSSLWAGPLCTQLLRGCGAEVWKVESAARPDGARFGERSFFDLLNAGKQSVALDLETDRGCRQLARLVSAADIVVESSRPRALRQLGIRAESLLREKPGRVWLSITGHGRPAPAGHWVAFGDDAAAAAGLLAGVPDAADAPPDSSRPPQFCGDAIADPLTGIHATAAALAYWRRGRSALLDVSLYGVAARAAAADPAPEVLSSVRPRAGSDGTFEVVSSKGAEAVARPRMRRPEASAAELGRDTHPVLAEVGASC